MQFITLFFFSLSESIMPIPMSQYQLIRDRRHGQLIVNNEPYLLPFASSMRATTGFVKSIFVTIIHTSIAITTLYSGFPRFPLRDRLLNAAPNEK
jgi:hypothetical protein